MKPQDKSRYIPLTPEILEKLSLYQFYARINPRIDQIFAHALGVRLD